MEYIIRKEKEGYSLREPSNGQYQQMWAYSTLDEALASLKRLYNPPIMVPDGMKIIGNK